MMSLVGWLLVAASTLGFASGAFTCYQFMNNAQAKSALVAVAKDRARYRKLLGFSEDLAVKDTEAETTNEEIAAAIVKAARASPGFELHCVDDGSLHELRKLQ